MVEHEPLTRLVCLRGPFIDSGAMWKMPLLCSRQLMVFAAANTDNGLEMGLNYPKICRVSR